MSLAEFEAKARAGGYDKVLNSEYYRSRIARLQDLHDQMAKLAEKYSATESIRMQDSLANVFQNTYLQDFYVKDKLEGQLSVNVNHFNEQELQDIVYQPWQGGNFSDRIWHNYTEVLPEVLTDVMMRSTVMGCSPSRTIKDFRDRFSGVSSKNIHRLVITEMGHAQEQATAKFYEDSDIEQYQYLATLESRTCDECAYLDEHIFNVKDRVTGKNYPLIHPYCRCTTVPYIKGVTGGEDRWYRDSNGKGNWTKDMTFAEWKKAQNIKPVKRLGRVKALPKLLTIAKGALNESMPNGRKRMDEHAKRYYEELRNSDRDLIYEKVSKSASLDRSEVEQALVHILDSKYELDGPNNTKVYTNFYPDYDMAESLQRLLMNNPEPHDIIMLKHEALEAQFMDKQGMSYVEAHMKANKQYNYQKVLATYHSRGER